MSKGKVTNTEILDMIVILSQGYIDLYWMINCMDAREHVSMYVTSQAVSDFLVEIHLVIQL